MSVVTFETEGRIALITMNRPERMNAMGRDLMIGLAEAFAEFQANRDLSVAILTGAGRAFCVGLDLKEHAESGNETLVQPDIHPHVNPFFPNHVLDKPTIAAVNGYAVGGGWFLAAQAELCVAAEHAVFEIAEVPRGSVSGWDVGHLYGLPSSIRFEIAFGTRFTAQRLYEVGMINEVVAPERLVEAAMARARNLLRIPPQVLRYNTELTRALQPQVPPHLERLKARYMAQVAAGPDAREAVDSFFEKRAPVFQQFD